MRHASIRQLYEYWNKQRGHRPAPDRYDIEPGPIRHILADTFILAVGEDTGHRFRIAGTRVCATFGRELKSERFLDLWSARSRPQMHDLLKIVSNEAIGLIASAHGASNDGSACDAELLLLPLAHTGYGSARVLGALAAPGSADWLGVATLGPLTLGTPRFLGQGLDSKPLTASPAGTPARATGRVRHGLVVYDGGLR